MHASYNHGRLWAQMNGDPPFILFFYLVYDDKVHL